MATLADLENALINADRAGDTEAVRILADEIIRMRGAAAQPAVPVAAPTAAPVTSAAQPAAPVAAPAAAMPTAPAAGGMQPSLATSRGVRSDMAAAPAAVPQPEAPVAQAQPVPQAQTFEQTFGIPPTTAPGVIGAITRGLAPVTAGAAAGAALGAALPVPGGPAIGAGTMAAAPIVLDPVVRAFNQYFGTSYPTISEAFGAVADRLGIPRAQSPTEQAVETGTRAVGAGVAAPAGAARAVQLAVPEASTAARIAEATRVGGMGPTGAGGLTGAAGLGTRAGAAATSGAIGGVAAEGTPASAVGGAVGGVGGAAAFGAARSVLGGLWDNTVGRMKPAKAAEDMLFEALGGTPQAGREAIEAARRGQAEGMGVEGMVGTPVTPGYNRTLAEMLIAGGVRPTSEMVQLERDLINAGRKVTDDVFKFQTDQVGALRTQLAQINDQLRVPMLTPGRLRELTQVRDNLVARVEAEESVLQAAERARIEASAGPQAAGEALAKRAEELSRGLRETLVRKSYDDALKSAGNTKTNIDGLIADAERVLKRPLWDFAPNEMPAVARAISNMAPQTRQVPAAPAGGEKLSARLARRTSGATPTGPATATLAQLDDLRKAINADISAASRGTGNLAGITQADLKTLHSSVDKMVRESATFSDETKELYDTALSNYRNVYAPRFRAGETARVLQPTKYGENIIDPSETVGRYLANEDASRQFLRTFAGDTTAFSAMRDGIVALAQRQAIPNGVTVSPEGLQKFMANYAPQIRMFEEAGMNVRGALLGMERRAVETQDALKRLQATRGPFEGKTPEQILNYVKADPARMRLAMDRSDDIGKDAIRRVLGEQLNAKLADDPAAALKELTDETSRAAYQVALGNVPNLPRNLLNEFTERARLGVATREAMADPALRKPGAAEAVIARSNLTVPQLQALLKVTQEDIARIRQLDDMSRATAGTPTVQARMADEVGGTSIMPNQSMDATSNTLLRVFKNLERRINYKRNAELARIIYGNPGEAITAINNAIRRAEQAAKPAGVTRAVPAAAGAIGGQFGEEVRRQYQSEPQQ